VAGRTEDAIALADRALNAHLALTDAAHMSHPGIHLIARGLALMEGGRLAEADATCAWGYEEALSGRVVTGQAWFALLLGRVALARGLAVDAANWFREGAGLYRRVRLARPH